MFDDEISRRGVTATHNCTKPVETAVEPIKIITRYYKTLFMYLDAIRFFAMARLLVKIYEITFSV